MKESSSYSLYINGEEKDINFDNNDEDSQLVKDTIRILEKTLNGLKRPSEKKLYTKPHNRRRNSRETREMLNRIKNVDVRSKILNRHLEILRGQRDGIIIYESKNGSVSGLRISEKSK